MHGVVAVDTAESMAADPAPRGAAKYLFGPFELDPRARTLTRGASVLPLPPKAVETLLVLVERPGEVITRDELIDRVWPDAFVEPNNLAQQISMIRDALEDRGAAPRFVETVSRRGYRFVASVSTGEMKPDRADAASGPGGGPPIAYARSGSVNIAYQVVGTGSLDIVFVMGWVSHLEEFWTEPSFARFLRRLSAFSRLIVFDKRGTGLSDRVGELPTLEQRMDDVRAVMDAARSQRAVLLGVSEGGPMCSLFAATYPERTLGLIVIGSYARRLWAPDYPWGPTESQREAFYREIERNWGGPLGIEDRAPSRADDPEFRSWWAHYLRQGASPGAALALTRMNAEVDVRDVLPLVRVPTLVLHRTGDRCLRVEEGRYLASRIPRARLVELPGSDHLPFVGDQEQLLAEIESFVATSAGGEAADESALASVLSLSCRSGCDPRRIEELIAAELTQYRGVLSETDEHMAVVTFDGPARAIRAGLVIVTRLAASDAVVGGGLHTGECVRRDRRVEGGAVDLAKAIARRASAGELLISRTVKDLVAGGGFRFAERGRHRMPLGVGEWRLYEVSPGAG
jgi:DNA-binding winged helix-turn-helix (wHTH) protein/alpha-beta hydrolase superfamily lysophospholipase